MSTEQHPVVTCAEAVALEKGLLNGEPEREWQAMSRAGAALGRAVLRDYAEIGPWPVDSKILILAGKGHNAGDAFLAAVEILQAHSAAQIDVLFLMGEKALNPLARRAWSHLLGAAGAAVSLRSFSLDRRREITRQLAGRCGGHYHLCLDGVFGMNFRPPFREPAGEAIGWLNEHLDADLRAAVDLPSGLSDTPSELALRADFSYMTGSAKRPLFLPEHCEIAGRLRYLDLGFFDDRKESPEPAPPVRTILLPGLLRPLRRLRGTMTHKRKFGHLLVAGGSRSMPGAILMSVLAAARSGVGLLTAAVPESLVAGLATAVPEAMWIGCPETEEGGLALDSLHKMERLLGKASAVLVGPGIGVGPETQALLQELVRMVESPLVLDAEALQPKVIGRLGGKERVDGRVVITPHAGEFARIAGRTFPDCGEEGLLDFCRESGLLTLLKGPPFTRLCDGRRIEYALAGGPVLARGGSGDLLAGMIGAAVARTPGELLPALRRSAVWHGLAAEACARTFGQEAVRTTQFLDFLPRVLRGEEEGAPWRQSS